MSKNGKLLFKYIAPSVVSVIAIFLCTVIDGIFVGRGVSTDALGAINIAYPFIMFYVALILLCTIGGMTITAIRIGRKDIEGANISFMHSVWLCVLITIIMTFIGIFLTEPVCRLLGADEQFINLSKDYLFYYSIFFFPYGLMIAFCTIVRTDGEPVLVSIASIVTTILIIVGDWILIFPLKIGIKGAAISNGIAHVIGLTIVFIHFFRQKGILKFKIIKFDMSLVKKIVIRGIPECVNQFSVPITVVLINLDLVKYIGGVGVNAFALVSYVASFTTSYFTGVTEGIQPLFGKAYGEEKEDDLRYFFKWGKIISFVGAFIIVLILFFYSSKIYLLYNPEKEVLDMAIKATTFISLGFLPQSIIAIISTYLYSTTRTKYSTIINTLCGFIVNIIVLIIMPMIFGGESIWICFFIYESIVLIIAIILRRVADKNGIILKTIE